MSGYQLILTDVGAATIEAAYQSGEVVFLTTAAFGDGGGQPVIADPAATSLVGQFGDTPLISGDSESGLIGGVATIKCRDYPGRVVREFGLMSSEGVLIAYGAYPDTYLPTQEDSILKELVVKFIMPIVHADCVELVVDPNIAVLTIEAGDARYLNESENLADVDDIDASRANLGCGSAATHNAQESSIDTTDGAVLTVGAFGLGGNSIPVSIGSSVDLTKLPRIPFSAFREYTTNDGSVYLIGIGGISSVATENIVEWLAPENGSDGKKIAIRNKDTLFTLYSDKNPPPYPVISVNGMHGDVQIDVGYTPENPPPEPDLSGYYTKTQSDARYLQGVQLGAEASTNITLSPSRVPSGCVQTGGVAPGGDNIGTMYYKPIQKNINGVWVTISG